MASGISLKSSLFVGEENFSRLNLPSLFKSKELSNVYSKFSVLNSNGFALTPLLKSLNLLLVFICKLF